MRYNQASSRSSLIIPAPLAATGGDFFIYQGKPMKRILFGLLFTLVGALQAAPITDVKLQNTSASAQTAVPITFGQVFAMGDVKKTDVLTGSLAGAAVPLQVDVKATHADGSVRHAIISAVVPKLPAGTTPMQIATGGAASSAAPASFRDAAATANVTLTIAGVKYTASLADALAATPAPWLAGPVAAEVFADAPLKNAAGVVHPLLTVKYGLRWYPAAKAARIEVVVENTKVSPNAPSVKHANYDVVVDVDGKQVYAKPDVAHLAFTRWRRVFWTGGAPAVHVRHNTPYLLASKAFPNYDPTLIGNMSADGIANYKAGQEANKDLFQPGIATAYMPTTGGRPDIGLLPGWDVMYLLNMTPEARDLSLTQSELMGGWDAHRRDVATGQPLLYTDYPKGTAFPGAQAYDITGVTASNPAVITAVGHKLKPGMQVFFLNVNGIGNINYNNLAVGAVSADTFAVTGLNTVGQTYTGGGIAVVWNPNVIDVSHVPAVGYVPYLLSGDRFFLEEMQFYASFVATGEQGTGLFYGQQLRAQAWGHRALAQASYATPDADRLKAFFIDRLNANLDDDIARYVTNPKANKLGAVVDGSAWSDPDSSGNVTRTWQDDFITQAIGQVLELGFTKAAPFFAFKAKYPVSRMNYSRMMSSTYSLKLRPDNSSPVFDNIDQVFAASYPANIIGQAKESAAMAALVGPTNFETLGANDMVGYPGGALGYGANMQPALAYAVTHGAPGAAAAWEKYQGRATKQDYSVNAEFAIVPRISVTVTPPIVTAPPRAGIIVTPSSTKVAKLKGLTYRVFNPVTMVVVKDFNGVAPSSKNIFTLTDAALVPGAQNLSGAVIDPKANVVIVVQALTVK